MTASVADKTNSTSSDSSSGLEPVRGDICMAIVRLPDMLNADDDTAAALDDLGSTLARLERKCAAACSSLVIESSFHDLHAEFADVTATWTSVMPTAAGSPGEPNDDDYDAWLEQIESLLGSLAASCTEPEALDAIRPDFADAIALTFFDLARLCEQVGLVVPAFPATDDKIDIPLPCHGGMVQAATITPRKVVPRRYPDDTDDSLSSDSDDEVAWCSDMLPQGKRSSPRALRTLFTNMAMTSK
ncbi:hypothetical protein H310_10916 [Aphanomyces invadans]|uniref:Uncharacterized protein n=1 Tax=Aphanomyces invadans TaxID=157072 RepID=A0A024TPE9_9STRA|nr:hypothetical protein H310_10916 [Aphanomyces invadans]ETV95878.1 hypothetical protein H310_10916 [Aphanomyces invadans]|eukprot:XP_008875629.1 hypothetical protein H310_10916 [Aphanomyces invadans]